MSLSDKIRTDRPEGFPSICPDDVKQAVAELKDTIKTGIFMEFQTEKAILKLIDKIFGTKLIQEV
jgi:hypothetical protein